MVSLKRKYFGAGVWVVGLSTISPGDIRCNSVVFLEGGNFCFFWVDNKPGHPSLITRSFVYREVFSVTKRNYL